MQIHRFDIPSSGSAPRPALTSGANAERGPANTGSRENDAEGAVNSSELEQLSRQLDGISEVRPDVVAAAKLKVQSGEYLTRTAAEGTAASILNKDV